MACMKLRAPLIEFLAMFHPVRQPFIKEYRNSTVHYEPGATDDELKVVTNTRRRVRLPGTEGLQDNYRHWQVLDESTTKRITIAPSSFRATPSWASAIDDLIRDEDDPPYVHATAPRRAPRRFATPGSSYNAIQGHPVRSLRQASILHYLAGNSRRDPAPPQARAVSLGHSASCPILVLDNSPNNQDDRTSTRIDASRGSILFYSSSVCFAVAPGLHPTMVAVVQHPVPQSGPQLEWNTSTKRKLYDAILAEESETESESSDIFSSSGRVEHNPVASTSTSHHTISSSSGNKRLCIEVSGSARAAPDSANSKGKARAL